MRSLTRREGDVSQDQRRRQAWRGEDSSSPSKARGRAVVDRAVYQLNLAAGHDESPTILLRNLPVARPGQL
eukprot:6602113-Prymnesium_polylepis.2